MFSANTRHYNGLKFTFFSTYNFYLFYMFLVGIYSFNFLLFLHRSLSFFSFSFFLNSLNINIECNEKNSYNLFFIKKLRTIFLILN